jgi:hypothetical protein
MNLDERDEVVDVARVIIEDEEDEVGAEDGSAPESGTADVLALVPAAEPAAGREGGSAGWPPPPAVR